MEQHNEFEGISFDLPKNQSNVIKVIGVGGGGSNAINHMFKQGISGVDFVVCNTDAQALQNSPVPNKIQLGLNLTEGLGAGANPDVGYQAAIESVNDIDFLLENNTKMVFITAGMGGGTGTGAAPVLAQMAREKDILTVGIVTIPFEFEGKNRREQAIIGLEKLRKQVDSLIVINNNKLREVYGNLGFKAGFSKADEVLATAAKGIAEVITHHYTQNIDLKDTKTVLSNSGTAIMGSAKAQGENRAKEGIISALDSPLLNDNKIHGAKNVLLLIVSGTSEITIDEIGEINDHIQHEAGHHANIIMGIGEDTSLEEFISITIIATGFNIDQQAEIVNTQPKKIVHPLTPDQINEIDFTPEPLNNKLSPNQPFTQNNSEKIVFDLNELEDQDIEIIDVSENNLLEITESIKNLDVTFELVSEEKNPIVEITNAILNLEVNTPELVSDQTTSVNPITTPAIESDQVVKHSLEDYLEVENKLFESKPTDSNNNITFDLKVVDNVTNSEPKMLNADPTELSIEDTLRLKLENRSEKLKKFNYQFSNLFENIENLEKEPAYKRIGIQLDDKNQENTNSNSRVSNKNQENDLLFGRGNSFLHDNVD